MTSIFYESIDFAKWYYKNDPTHVAFFCEETFDFIAKEFGFEIVDKLKNIVILRKK